MILLASVFRNSSSYLARYVDQVKAFREAVSPDSLHVIAVEGDSTDDTYNLLDDASDIDTLLTCEHGGPTFPSTIHPLRWRQLSVACNTALCAAMRISQPDDIFIYVESDLVWEPDTFLKLMKDLDEVPAVAPMSMMGMTFYDVWGHTYDGGTQFKRHVPHYEGWHVGVESLRQIDTAGSCFVTTADALRVIEFSAIDCIRGIGRSLYSHGLSLYVDPTVRVEHLRDDHHE